MKGDVQKSKHHLPLLKSVIPIVINRKERYNKNNLKSKNKLGISKHKEKKMSTKVEKALELHDKGYNCAQAVACSFCEEFGVDQETMFKISEGFGFGMGMMDMCGAVTGMMMVIGMDNSIGNLENGKATKADTYKKKNLQKNSAKRTEPIIVVT